MSQLEAYMYNGNFTVIKLDKTIQILDEEHLVKDTRKLQEKLNKERARDPSIIGIVEAKHLRVKIHETGTFSCIVWETRKRITGNWTV